MTLGWESSSGVVWTQLWQITLLIGMVGVVSRLVARNRPYLSHALWLIVLIKCITPPVVSSPTGVFCWVQPWAIGRAVETTEGETLLGDNENLPEARVLSGSVRTETQPLAELLANSDGTLGDSEVLAEPAKVEPIAPGMSKKRVLLSVLTVVWSVGTLGIFVVTGVWFGRGMRRLRRDGCRIDRRLQRLARSLARQLGLRRRVRVVVTNSRVGPAVFGLMRPTVILPEIIVQGRTDEEIEPILAHELIHIRRGDLWVGLLQTIAQAVWWFHPMVWCAGRCIYRDAERCCDEAVVAELNCRPSRYARSLLEVLARKQDLVPLPSLPGVRPVELTSKRMERIMRLGQGSRGRSPWWCWAIMLLVGAVTLPGAARIIAADEAKMEQKTEQTDTAVDPGCMGQSEAVAQAEPAEATVTTQSSVKKPLPPVPQPAARYYGANQRWVADSDSGVLRQLSPASPVGQGATAPRVAIPPARQSLDAGPGEVRVYNVDKLIPVARKEFGISKQEAERWLESVMIGPKYPNSLPSQDRERPKLEWYDDRAVVKASKRRHKQIQRTLKAIDKHGPSQITLDIRFVTAPSEVINEAKIEWMSRFDTASSGTEKSTSDRSASEPNMATNRARTIVEKTYPMRMTILDKKQKPALLTQLQELKLEQKHQKKSFSQSVYELLRSDNQLDKRGHVNILKAPRITVFNGQQAFVQDCSQSPFVVDYKTETSDKGVTHQPVVRVLDEGVKLELSAMLIGKNRLRLDCHAKYSKIGNVETLTTKVSAGGKPVKIQAPEYMTTEFATTVELAAGQTILIDGQRTKDDNGRLISSLVMITPSKVIPAKTKPYPQVAAQPHPQHPRPARPAKKVEPLYFVAYDVGDLVVPVPNFVDNSGGHYVGPKPKGLTINFEPLIELITSTIEPESWEDTGGRGTIASYENNLTLQVHQTKTVHQEITEVLAQLRRLQDVQVMLDVRRIDLDSRVFERSGIELEGENSQTLLSPREAKLFWELARSTDKDAVLQSPRITLFNGQMGMVGNILGADETDKLG